jgi:hypothetical protein
MCTVIYIIGALISFYFIALIYLKKCSFWCFKPIITHFIYWYNFFFFLYVPPYNWNIIENGLNTKTSYMFQVMMQYHSIFYMNWSGFCFCSDYWSGYLRISKKKKLYQYIKWVIIGLKHQNEQFFSYIKAMKQKEIKAPIIYITVHIPLVFFWVKFIFCDEPRYRKCWQVIPSLGIMRLGTDLGSITFKCNRLHYWLHLMSLDKTLTKH